MKEGAVFLIIVILATHFILYLHLNVHLNHTDMYPTKASMILNACQHIMPVGTIQKPCFIDNFLFSSALTEFILF